MSRHSYALKATETERWKKVLQRCTTYDVYHLPEYRQSIEEQEDVQALLFVHETASAVVAMPLLLRRIERVLGLEASRHFDATSVYGYPGPVSSDQNPSEEIIHSFAAALRDYLKSKEVVSAFSRLHPLFDQEPLLSTIGQVLDVGPTVAIDLSLPLDVQWQQYRNNHKRDVERARADGVICIHDVDWSYLDAFVEVYYETMRRVDADDYYFFDQTYFARLRDSLDGHLHLFVALKEGAVLSGALFTTCNSIIQYHLGGTRTRYLDVAPSKLVFDAVRLWGTGVGADYLHLGGGVGGKKDGLFRFKAGFSNQTFQFKVWRMIVNHLAYQQLTSQKQAWNKTQGLEVIDDEYFPAYRALTRSVSSSQT